MALFRKGKLSPLNQPNPIALVVLLTFVDVPMVYSKNTKPQATARSTAPKKDGTFELAAFRDLVKLVEGKKWEEVFHYLQDDSLDVYAEYKKSVHGDRKVFQTRYAKLFQEDSRLDAIKGELVFAHFLSDKLGVHTKSKALCEEDEFFNLKRSNDPIFKALKKLDRRIDRNVYIEGFGGDWKYGRFLENDGPDGVFSPPFHSTWTKFCFSKKKFWLTQIGEKWARLLGDRRSALDAAFAGGSLSLTDAVSLSNWYIENVPVDLLPIDAAAARIKKTTDGYELHDPKQAATVRFDAKTRTIKEFTVIRGIE